MLILGHSISSKSLISSIEKNQDALDPSMNKPNKGKFDGQLFIPVPSKRSKSVTPIIESKVTPDVLKTSPRKSIATEIRSAGNEALSAKLACAGSENQTDPGTVHCKNVSLPFPQPRKRISHCGSRDSAAHSTSLDAADKTCLRSPRKPTADGKTLRKC